MNSSIKGMPMVIDAGDIGTKTITENGVYNASADNLDGYSEVTVDVENQLTYAMTSSTPNTYKAILTQDSEGYINVEIPSGVTSIGINAFTNWISARSLTIPNSVTIIEDNVFFYWTSATSVSIGTGVTSIGTSAFLRWFSATSLTIPNNVTTIGTSAFGEWTSATSVSIGTGVTSIGTTAFDKLGVNLTGDNVYVELLATTPPTLSNKSAFGGGVRNYKIHLPTASESAYSTATNWSILYSSGRLVFDL